MTFLSCIGKYTEAVANKRRRITHYNLLENLAHRGIHQMAEVKLGVTWWKLFYYKHCEKEEEQMS